MVCIFNKIKKANKSLLTFSLCLSLIAGSMAVPSNVFGAQEEASLTGVIKYLGSYSTGSTNRKGGIAEIVKYNKDNKKMYIVNGQTQSIDVVSLENLKSGEKNTFSKDFSIDVANVIANASISVNNNTFVLGDVTSVDVNTKKDFIGVAVQAEGYTDNGLILLLNYDGTYNSHFEAGVQPDMVIFTPDGKLVLCANEGEPRNGYGEGATDPKGSVTIVDLDANENNVVHLNFDAYDTADQVKALTGAGVLLKPDSSQVGATPSVDLEPEYIAISENSKTAYVSLQEANAIATINLENKGWTSIKGLGFKDHNTKGNGLDFNRNKKIKIQKENVYGIYMPDGIATVNINGVQYVLSANEGDGREWGTYANTDSKTINGSDKKVEYFKKDAYLDVDGMADKSKTYLQGARSFSIWNPAEGSGLMHQVYDSKAEFEEKTGEKFPDNFNANHETAEMEVRSNKKGPEPEDVKVVTSGSSVYAFIGLERIGGVMMYDITDPSSSAFVDYINTRDFAGADLASSGDLGTEGLCVINAADSPNKNIVILAANEVSGTVAVYEIPLDHSSENNNEDSDDNNSSDNNNNNGSQGNSNQGNSQSGSSGSSGSSSSNTSNSDSKTRVTKDKDGVSIVHKTSKDEKIADLELTGTGFKEILKDGSKAGVTVKTGLGTMSFDEKTLRKIEEVLSENLKKSATQGNVKISIEKVDESKLTTINKEVTKDRPVYSFNIKVGDSKVSGFDGGRVRISLPYTSASGEDLDALVVYYLTEEGKVEPVRGKYNKETGQVDLVLSHFSYYVIGHNNVKFNDVSDTSWYSSAVKFLGAREVTTGTGNGKFSPEENIKRGDFLVMLMKAYNIKAGANNGENFSDSGNTYYTSYLGKAKELGLANGLGNNLFAPERAITRQEAATLLYGALKALNEVSVDGVGNGQLDFKDSNTIDSWAKEAMVNLRISGAINGYNGYINPKGNLTRAEMSQMLYNLINK